MEKKRTKKELEEEIKTKNKEIKEPRNKYLMALADLENYKKRAKKESGEFMKYANERLLKELISVVDNFERALTVKHSNNDFSKGIELIYKHLLNVLKKEGVEAFESVGKEFDPRYHEAVSVVPSKHKDGIVIEELEKGYNLKGKLARPARVVVTQKDIL